MKYKDMTHITLENIGGIDNISHVGHCATRLRINVKDENKVQKETLSNLENIHGFVLKNGQVQLIIGSNVGEAYNDFMEVSGFAENQISNTSSQEVEVEETRKKGFKFYVNVIGDFSAEIFMPIVPALITGGVILAANNFMINYLGVSPESGTAEIILAIFSAAFSMLPVYLGYTIARKIKLSPIMGAFLGAILVNPAINGVEGLDFLGIPVVPVEYQGSVVPIVMGVGFMYFVDKHLEKFIPEFAKFLLKPFVTMLIVVPFTLILFGPIGTILSDYVGNLIIWLMDTAGFIALPLLAALYPYMVMLGLDKAIMPIGFNAVASLGYDPVVMAIGFISNLCVGASALAVSRIVKENKEKSGAYFSFGLTGVFGITEPAFYGALIGRPKALIGTAIGAVTGGLVAGIFGLVSYVMGGAPGLFTLLFFLNPDGSMGNFVLSLIVAATSIMVSFITTTIILKRDERKEIKVDNKIEEGII
ncbi:PTS transporter subunit EIIC [Marinilactibacillus psychrotolerans]|uniref:Protein-N(Pi)-phosphohistidine--sugar phosphotransferase n=1 Tax=Marinilactibacillus psychrotolerans TaxID=191770 RepID=A0A5R9C8D5_9LACT|nr:PTS transporter subunit EIIC [Marinilactibacillus psychrotolerans]TLQ09585.1 protein-N(pi)-phosphohistidine--sugar phosphotransferase [Marinilactibacillus psychrotolerans]